MNYANHRLHIALPQILRPAPPFLANQGQVFAMGPVTRIERLAALVNRTFASADELPFTPLAGVNSPYSSVLIRTTPYISVLPLRRGDLQKRICRCKLKPSAANPPCADSQPYILRKYLENRPSKKDILP